jgi:hypothetical protein
LPGEVQVKKARQIVSNLTALNWLQVLCALNSGAKNVTKSNYLHAYNSSPNPTAKISKAEETHLPQGHQGVIKLAISQIK